MTMSEETASTATRPPAIVAQDLPSSSVTRPLVLIAVAIVLLIGIVLYFVIGQFVDDLLHIFTNLFQ
jgi:uncharacterized membrane protein YqhA